MKKISLTLSFVLTSICSQSLAIDSTIVFMRSSFVGSLIKASVYDVTNEETKFIGILKNKKKLTYKATAGKHVYMVVSEAADFMEANIVDGKTYYSVITPRTGAWKARFSMSPIRNDGTTKFNMESKKIKKIMKKVKLVETSEKHYEWYNKNKESVEKKRAKYWVKWQEKSVEDLALRTLNPDDGINY